MKEFLFGYVIVAFNTPRNYLILWLKKFIWNCKFKGVENLSITGFKNFLLYAVRDLKRLYEIKESPASFNKWDNLYVLLEADRDDGPPHTQVQHLLIQAA